MRALQAGEFDRLPAPAHPWRVARQIIHARRDHAHGAGHQFGWPRALHAVGCHVMHVTMEALRQPGRKTRLGRRQVHPATPIWENPSSRAHSAFEERVDCCTTYRPDCRKRQRCPLAPPATLLPNHAPIHLAWREDTAAFAQRLAAQPCWPTPLVTLHGDLGAGKTTLVRHLLRALGVQGRIKSPTYAVVEPPRGPGLHIWHFDFYRFDDPREWKTPVSGTFLPTRSPRWQNGRKRLQRFTRLQTLLFTLKQRMTPKGRSRCMPPPPPGAACCKLL